MSLSLPSAGNTLSISKQVTVRCAQASIVYALRGIVYYANTHFTSQIVTTDGDIWYDDGIVTGSQMLYNGKLAEMSEMDLCNCKEGIATLSIYSKE